VKDRFKVKTFIPSLSSFTYVDEITNNSFIIINKYISSNDNEGLGEYLNSIFDNNYTSFDKFFILLSLRSICIGDKIVLKVNQKEKPPLTLKLSIKQILKKIVNFKLQKIPDFYKNDLIIKFKLPSKLHYNNLLNLLYDIIDDISVQEKLPSIRGMSEKNKISVIQKFNKEVLRELKEHVFKNAQIIELTDLEEFSNVKICFTNNMAFKILKLFFTLNISILYYKMYNALQKCNVSHEGFLSITPAESDLLSTIHKTINNIK
jgi:hypothetical protein